MRPTPSEGRRLSLSYSKSLVPALLAVLLLPGASNAQESVRLRYDFQSGQILRYRLNMSSNATFRMPDGQVEKLNMTNYLELSQELIEKTDEGNFRVAVTIDKVIQTVNGKNNRVPVPEGQVNIIEMMPNGQVVNIQSSAPATSSQSLQMVFPSKPLRKGDSWDQTQTLTHPLPLETKTEYEVSDLHGSFPGYQGETVFIRSQMALENSETPTKEVVSSRTNGNLWFDAKNGRIVRSKGVSNFTFDLPISIPDLVPEGSNVKLDLQLNVEIALTGVEKK